MTIAGERKPSTGTPSQSDFVARPRVRRRQLHVTGNSDIYHHSANVNDGQCFNGSQALVSS